MHTSAYFLMKVMEEFHTSLMKEKLYVQFMMKFQQFHVMRQLSKDMIQKSLFVIEKNLN